MKDAFSIPLMEMFREKLIKKFLDITIPLMDTIRTFNKYVSKDEDPPRNTVVAYNSIIFTNKKSRVVSCGELESIQLYGFTELGIVINNNQFFPYEKIPLELLIAMREFVTEIKEENNLNN